MGLFVRKSTAPSDKYGAIVYYVDDNGFVRKSNGPSDKYGAVVYYVDDSGFVRKSNGPSDKYGEIVYYVDGDGFVRKSNGPSDKYGAIIYYVNGDGFVRKSNGPSDKYGAIVYYVEVKKEKEKKPEPNQPNQAQGVMLAIAFVIGLLLAPILIVLGMFGKFLLGGIYKNAVPLKAFQKFRKIYSIISLVWLGLGIAGIIVTVIVGGVETALYALAGGNVLLFILSIVIGNKIYNKHKHELPTPVETTVGAGEKDRDVGITHTTKLEDVPQKKTVNTATSSADGLTRELIKYKTMLDSGLISEDEYNDLKGTLFRSLGVSKSSNSTVSVVFLWICSVLNFLGIFINMMISLGVWGDLYHMYTYILGGYIAGFSVIAICTPTIIGLSMALKEKAQTNTSIKNAIIGGLISITLTTFLMMLSAFL